MNIIPRARWAEIKFYPGIAPAGIRCMKVSSGEIVECETENKPIWNPTDQMVSLRLEAHETDRDEFTLYFTNDQDQAQSIQIYTRPELARAEKEIRNVPGLPRTGKDSVLLEIAAGPPTGKP